MFKTFNTALRAACGARNVSGRLHTAQGLWLTVESGLVRRALGARPRHACGRAYAALTPHSLCLHWLAIRAARGRDPAQVLRVAVDVACVLVVVRRSAMASLGIRAPLTHSTRARVVAYRIQSEHSELARHTRGSCYDPASRRRSTRGRWAHAPCFAPGSNVKQSNASNPCGSYRATGPNGDRLAFSGLRQSLQRPPGAPPLTHRLSAWNA